jgi:hypothetical protein
MMPSRLFWHVKNVRLIHDSTADAPWLHPQLGARKRGLRAFNYLSGLRDRSSHREAFRPDNTV